MIGLALVVGAAILLTLLVLQSYSRQGADRVRVGRRTTKTGGRDAGWVYADAGSAGDCSAGGGGGGCADGGGGGGGD